MTETATLPSAAREAARLAAELHDEARRVHRLRRRLDEQVQRIAALRRNLERNRCETHRFQAELGRLWVRWGEATAGFQLELGLQGATLSRLQASLARQEESASQVREGLRDSGILEQSQREELELRFRP